MTLFFATMAFFLWAIGARMFYSMTGFKGGREHPIIQGIMSSLWPLMWIWMELDG